MALEDLIDAETEDKIYRKGQKRERFMHNFNSEAAVSMPGLGWLGQVAKPPTPRASAGPTTDVTVKVSGDPTYYQLNKGNDVGFAFFIQMVPPQKEMTAMLQKMGMTEIPVTDKSLDKIKEGVAKLKSSDGTTQKITVAQMNQQYGSAIKTIELRFVPMSSTTEGVFKKSGVTITQFSGPKSGCFIATAAFGTPMAPEIDVLRTFRDVKMMPTKVGRALVGAYYRVSPPIAYLISRSETLKRAVRGALTPIVHRRG